MTRGLWVAIFVFVGTTAVSLSIAYMHRKQMRQIELYRKDVQSGLVPPLNPFPRFLRKYWWETTLVIASMYWVVRWFIEESQHSYHAGVSAALAVWVIVNLCFAGWTRILGTSAEVASRMIDIHERHLENTELLFGLVVKLTSDLAKSGHLSKQMEEEIASDIKRWSLKCSNDTTLS